MATRTSRGRQRDDTNVEDDRPEAVRRPRARLLVVAPRTATQHSILSGILHFTTITHSVWIRFVEAVRPLPDVARHLLRAVWAGPARIAADGGCAALAAFAGIGTRLVERITPGIETRDARRAGPTGPLSPIPPRSASARAARSSAPARRHRRRRHPRRHRRRDDRAFCIWFGQSFGWRCCVASTKQAYSATVTGKRPIEKAARLTRCCGCSLACASLSASGIAAHEELARGHGADRRVG